MYPRMSLAFATTCCFWWILAAVALTRPAAVAAEWVLLNFEGVGDYFSVDDYYGSYDGGPMYGIVFDGAYCIEHGGITTFTANEPSPPTVAAFNLAYGGHYFTTPNGFTGLSFQYASKESATVTVYDGPDKAGNVLASATLPVTDLDGGLVDVWTGFTLSFPGVAKSAAFSSAFAFYDDMLIQLVRSPPAKAPTFAPSRACAGNTYWIWNPKTDALVGELKNNTGQCIAFPYNLEARPCSGPRTMPVTIVLKNSAQVKIRTQKEYVAPFFFWGDDPVKGDVFRSTSRLKAGTYWLYTTVDGKEERIRFTQTC
jgi:hypothetical protein